MGRGALTASARGHTRGIRPLSAGATALLLFLLLPDPAYAWGPATHICLGLGVLESLWLLPPAVRSVIGRYPMDFLYGSIAADISLAKKYVPEGRHCHHWPIGEEIYASADDERLEAVGLGYLSHLAADTVAHNVFVPRQLLLTSTSKALGHSYWEHRMDVQLGERYGRIARRVVMEHDHSAADELFDEVLSATLFSFQTNRRIFRGMIRFQDNERWRAVFSRVLESSRWSLPSMEIHGYLERSFDFVIDYLRRRGDSMAVEYDPTGEEALRIAKQLRRGALEADDPGRLLPRLHSVAEGRFPLPPPPFRYWEGLPSTQVLEDLQNERGVSGSVR